MTTKVAFLIDLNAIPLPKSLKAKALLLDANSGSGRARLLALPQIKKEVDIDSQLCEVNPEPDVKFEDFPKAGSPKCELKLNSTEEEENHPDDFDEPSCFRSNLNLLKQYVAQTLVQKGTVNDEFNSDNFQWTYKFFDSSQPTGSRYGKRFLPVDISSFETFEEDLDREIHSFISAGKGCHEVNKLAHLSFSIKNLMSDVTWGNVFTPIRSTYLVPNEGSGGKTKRTRTGNSKEDKKTSKNFIYALFRVPRDEAELVSFVGEGVTSSESQIFVNNLLPKAFFTELHRKHHICLNFVDMWYLHENKGVPLSSKWKPRHYAKPIPRVLTYLDGGQVLQLTPVLGMPLGTPAWINVCRYILKANSMTLPVFEPKKGRHDRTRLLPNGFTSSPGSNSKGSGSTDQYLKNGLYDSVKKTNDVPLATPKTEHEDWTSSTSLVPADKGQPNKYHRRSSGNIQGLGGDRTMAVPSSSFLQKKNNHVLVPKAWVHMVQRDQERAEVLKKVLSIPAPRSRPTPKKVRRNLFSGQKNDPTDIETLIALASNSNFSRSPAVTSIRSPGNFSRNPTRSPYSATNESRLKVLKSKRRLHLDDEDDNVSNIDLLRDYENSVPESPDIKFNINTTNVICPESPSTPPTKKTKRCVTSSLASSERKVVQESPESFHSKYQRHSASKKIDSASFYSMSGSDSKSRAWEKSGLKLKEAKIKESIDLSELATPAVTSPNVEIVSSTQWFD